MTKIGKVFAEARKRRIGAWIECTLLVVFAGSLAMLAGCQKESTNGGPNDEIAPQNLFMFSALQAPAPAAGVAAMRVDLGRRLYYDQHLSVNGSLSCNSCHQLAKYGVDPGAAVSLGHNKKPGGRNSPTVYNAGLQFAQFWDGRAATLAAQASGPMMNPVEMGMSGPEAVLAAIHSNPAYVKQFKQAYADPKDPVAMENVTDAIAAFEGRLLTPARWDKYLAGDLSALSEGEKHGLRVYLEAGCAACHAGKGMGGNSYQKLGVYRNWPDEKADTGRLALTKEARDLMYFKVPTLRNVTETGPWFHDGQVKTIEEAVRLMAKHQSGEMLSDADVNSIVSFLGALKGDIPAQFVQPPAEEAPAGKVAANRGQSRRNHATLASTREGE
jgi:cytochrome c peroxidase